MIHEEAVVIHFWNKGGKLGDKTNIKRFCVGYLNPKSGKSVDIWEKLKELVEEIKKKTNAVWLSWSADTTNSMSGDYSRLYLAGVETCFLLSEDLN